MFYLFPRAISKKECKKLLKYCIKHTEFKKALILNKDEADTEGGIGIGRVNPKIRKTDIAFVEPDGNEGNQVNEIAWHYLNQANEINASFNYKIDTFDKKGYNVVWKSLLGEINMPDGIYHYMIFLIKGNLK